MASLLKKIDLIYDLVFAVLLFFVPLSIAVPNILLGALVILYLVKKKEFIIKERNLIILLVFLLFLIIKSIFFSSFSDNFSINKQLLTVLGLLFLTQQIKNSLHLFYGFLLGVFSSVILSSAKIISYFFSNKSLSLANSSEVSEILLIHRPYFGFMILLSIIVLVKVKNELPNFFKSKVYYFIGLFSIFVIFISARLAILCLLIFFIIYAVKRRTISKKKLTGIAILFLSIISFFLITNSSLKQRLHIENNIENTVSKFKDYEPRFVIWACFFDIIARDSTFNNMTGFSNSKTIQDKLNSCYYNSIPKESKRSYYMVTKFNSHNQYFDIFLRGGIIGLILFLSFLSSCFFYFKKDYIHILIILFFVLFLFVENLFFRQWGSYLFGIFIPLILMESNRQKSK